MARSQDRLAGLPAVFRWRQARQAGLHDPRLQQLLAEGAIERLGHGRYLRTDVGPVDTDQLELAVAAPSATLCLSSALAHHDLTDQIPAHIDVAVPRGQRRPATRAPVRWHQFAVDTFALGRDEVDL